MYLDYALATAPGAHLQPGILRLEFTVDLVVWRAKRVYVGLVDCRARKPHGRAGAVRVHVKTCIPGGLVSSHLLHT